MMSIQKDTAVHPVSGKRASVLYDGDAGGVLFPRYRYFLSLQLHAGDPGRHLCDPASEVASFFVADDRFGHGPVYAAGAESLPIKKTMFMTSFLSEREDHFRELFKGAAVFQFLRIGTFRE